MWSLTNEIYQPCFASQTRLRTHATTRGHCLDADAHDRTMGQHLRFDFSVIRRMDFPSIHLGWTEEEEDLQNNWK